MKKQIETVDEFLESLPKLSDEMMDLSESSQKLLKLIYGKAQNLPKSVVAEPLKPPLIISFHPKASLLNNNVHETYLAEKVAKKVGMTPIWIPYVYDTGYKTAANKIRLPSYVYFENKFIPIRSSAKIRGNIMATEKAITEKEVKLFFRELEKHELSTLTRLKGMLNPFNFGHYLFDLKRKVSGLRNKDVRERVAYFQKSWLNSIKGTSKLAESLAKISMANFKEFGINIGLLMMDEVLSEVVKIVFTEVLDTPSVKKDPSLLENLFLAYNLKSKERAPILYAGDGDFIGYDDYDVKAFEGKFEDLVNGLENHTVLPTGHLIMLLFTAIGCKLVLGGEHTMEYYPDYFEKAYSVLNETSFNSKMKLLSYGRIRCMDLRNITDVLSVIRILDKVGSRNYIKKGVFTIPDDIIDHLNFLSGFSSIPKEYKLLLEQIIDGESIGPTAHTKERERLREVEQIVKKNPEELLKNPTVLKKWIRGTKFDSLHPVRLEVLLENLRLDADMRLRKLEENIMFEQHILGGTLGEGFSDDEEGSIIYDGIIKRSNRYPSLFEMVYYGFKPLKTFMTGGTLEEHESDWIWKQFIHKKEEISDIKQMKFSDYWSVFKGLIPTDLIAPFMKFK